jgi:FlaA1/EpsC-like NDP-sugar epimerase
MLSWAPIWKGPEGDRMDPIIDQISREVLQWRGLAAATCGRSDEPNHGLEGRTVLVTGSGGSIGGEVARRLAYVGVERLVLLDMCEAGQFRLDRDLAGTPAAREVCLGDIADGPFVDSVFQRYRPEVVLHAAAYKHVPMLEAHPRAAVRANVIGTKRLAEAADRWGCQRMVMVSTDKAVSPVGVMGTTKKLAEMYLRSRAVDGPCAYTSVRFGNVIESSGNVFELFAHQIANGGPLTVTDPRAERYFMTLGEAAGLVLRAATVGRGGEVLVLNMGEPVRIERVARRMAELAGFDPTRNVTHIGLRPGERLDERLYEPQERSAPTEWVGINIAQSPRPAANDLDRAISMLEQAVDHAVEGVGESLALAMAMIGSGGVEIGGQDAR